MELQIEKAFSDQPGELKKIKSLVTDLGSVSNEFVAVKTEGFSILLTRIAPRVMQLSDSVIASIDFSRMTESEYSQYDIDNPFVRKFTEGIDGMLAPTKELLTEENYEKLVQCFVQYFFI